uniref:Major sperm protein n=1 Tax=Rhabditophanes sp. KR3021 TaxID=114890 RepID=A0AC35UCC4_9BILA
MFSIRNDDTKEFHIVVNKHNGILKIELPLINGAYRDLRLVFNPNLIIPGYTNVNCYLDNPGSVKKFKERTNLIHQIAEEFGVTKQMRTTTFEQESQSEAIELGVEDLSNTSQSSDASGKSQDLECLELFDDQTSYPSRIFYSCLTSYPSSTSCSSYSYSSKYHTQVKPDPLKQPKVKY